MILQIIAILLTICLAFVPVLLFVIIGRRSYPHSIIDSWLEEVDKSSVSRRRKRTMSSASRRRKRTMSSASRRRKRTSKSKSGNVVANSLGGEERRSRLGIYDLIRWLSLSLIVIALLILVYFIVLSQLDTAALISVLAFAVAVPLLAGTIVISFIVPKLYGKSALSGKTNIFFASIGIMSTLIGITAAIWHISWIFGVIFFVAVVIASVLYIAYAVFAI